MSMLIHFNILSRNQRERIAAVPLNSSMRIGLTLLAILAMAIRKIFRQDHDRRRFN
jgi:hypothetical protein